MSQGQGRTQRIRRMHHGPARREQLARAAWRLLMRVGELHMEEAGNRLTGMGLSPVMGHFLDEIARMPPGPISQLVAHMNVDPGWVTDVIDRLEERGDVRRVPSTEDRRVKIIELTEKGRASWRKMDDAIAEAPPELLALREHELRALLRIAERLAKAAGIGPGPDF
jgi:MarR family transcriptional regulator, 2-MHQ and catechol-resistance regulon repressor